MIIILGLVILVAALIVGVAGVLGNGATGHAVTHFSVLGYHLTGSSGSLFLSGIVVGAAGLVGLTLLLAGTRRRHRRGSAATRRLRQSRRETAAASQERDDLIEQRDTARANTTSNPGNSTAPQGPQLRENNDRWSRLRDIRRRLAPAQTTAYSDSPVPDSPASAPGPSLAASSAASDVPSGASDADVTAISPAPDLHAGASAAD
jgi:hypothetical protein